MEISIKFNLLRYLCNVIQITCYMKRLYLASRNKNAQSIVALRMRNRLYPITFKLL